MYKIIKGYHMIELEEKVNEYMEAGFRPLGGILYDKRTEYFYQPMVQPKGITTKEYEKSVEMGIL